MLSAFLDNQVSGNIWKPVHEPMVYQEYQQVGIRDAGRVQREVLHDLERQMARFEFEHEAEITEVKKQYVLPKDFSVRQFLREHLSLPQLLIEGAPILRVYFGADIVLALRAPIDESGTRTLYAVVMWPGKTEEVRAAIDRFDDEWWIPNSRRASGNLYFTYELV